MKTRHGEMARDLALRYSHTECALFMECVGESFLHTGKGEKKHSNTQYENIRRVFIGKC